MQAGWKRFSRNGHACLSDVSFSRGVIFVFVFKDVYWSTRARQPFFQNVTVAGVHRKRTGVYGDGAM